MPESRAPPQRVPNAEPTLLSLAPPVVNKERPRVRAPSHPAENELEKLLRGLLEADNQAARTSATWIKEQKNAIVP